MLAFSSCAGIRNFVYLQPVRTAFGGEHQQISVRGRNHQMFYDIFSAGAHANAAFAPARLTSISVHRGALQIAAVRHGNRHIFHLDQIFQVNFTRVFDNGGAPLVAEILLYFFQLLYDDPAQLLVGSQDFQVLGDLDLNGRQLIHDLLNLHAGQALELQLDDRLGLLFGEFESADQAVTRFLGRLRSADQFDDGVQVIESFLEAQ